MLRVVAVLSLCVVMFFPPLGNGNSSVPSLSIVLSPTRPPKLRSRLHKYTMFRNVCQVADYINVHVSASLSTGHVQIPRASPVLHWRARLRERKAQVQGGRWFKFTSVGTLVEFGEGGPCLARRNHLLRIDGRADGVGGKLRRGAHPLAGLVPVPEVVNLQLHAIAVGIHVVERGGHAVIQTGVRLDALAL